MRVIETVVVTRNSHINAAAIGVWKEGGFYFLRVFEGSNTFANLLKNEKFSINFVSKEQLHILLRCALVGHNNNVQELDTNAFLFWNDVPYLKESFSVIACVEHRELVFVEDWVGRARCLLVRAREVQSFGELKGIVSREEFIPILEAAVLATKYLDASDRAKMEIRSKLDSLLPLIHGYVEEVKLIKEILGYGEKG
ncbi:MAG: DUF447 family protein [Thermoplasmata archaeon]